MPVCLILLIYSCLTVVSMYLIVDKKQFYWMLALVYSVAMFVHHLEKLL